MADEIKELLAVLDLPKTEQHSWAVSRFPKSLAKYPQSSLADLAFRLRDEASWSAKGKAAWCQGCRIIIKMVNNSDEFPVWSQPIHWIIAALIAKELTE